MTDSYDGAANGIIWRVFVALFGLIALSLTLLWACKKCGLQSGDQLEDLRAPLVGNSAGTGHRLDKATRAAERGFIRCRCCRFENFKGSTSCALCGDDLPIANDEKAQFQSKNQSAGLSARQVRVRKRKEWQRKLDLEGHAFWFRRSMDRSRSMQASASTELDGAGGLVLVFTDVDGDWIDEADNLPVPPKSTNLADDSDDTNEANGITAAASSSPSSSNSEVADYVRLEGRKYTLISAADADPVVLPVGKRKDWTVERLREALDMASMDFPTRFAHFVVCSSSLLTPPQMRYMKLHVRRDYVGEQSLQHLACMEHRHLRSAMRINFVEESGIDAGGIQREWFMLMSDTLVDPLLELFVCTNKRDQTYYVAPMPVNAPAESKLTQLSRLHGTGRLIGRCLLEGGAMGFHLCMPLLKVLLGVPVTFQDLEQFDPELYKNLCWVLDYTGSVEDLCLTFSVSMRSGVDGEIVDVPLVPNGLELAVTEANKRQYVQRMFEHRMFDSVSDQIHALARGLYEVVPVELLMLFDYQEVDYLLCGSDEIDVDDWQRHTVVTSELTSSRVVRWFWEIVREMPTSQRRRLLHFATGCSRVPPIGFQGLTSHDGRSCLFTLKGVPYDEKMPCIRSHACFNRLDLPKYRARIEVKQMLNAALCTELYGFTTD
ncbi:TPA: hypothetical protein N0F65_013068 [Lagenidium giganteum]|uniref:HECT-type E3 ubiquitin transferase n=1 Tax=Lagenidium giganteum TaxID=4803 RepID=A0AAV2YFT5_9STRA|nr:TPA: hypothetical protein N0F65_013068 [Lagenidium giganteum]